jgi:hypothetical protein
LSRSCSARSHNCGEERDLHEKIKGSYRSEHCGGPGYHPRRFRRGGRRGPDPLSVGRGPMSTPSRQLTNSYLRSWPKEWPLRGRKSNRLTPPPTEGLSAGPIRETHCLALRAAHLWRNATLTRSVSPRARNAALDSLINIFFLITTIYKWSIKLIYYKHADCH